MKFVFVFLIFISQAWAIDRLQLAIPENEIHQGALVKARLLIAAESVQLPFQKLKGETLGETIYFHLLSPLFKKDGSSQYESDVQIIFIKVPKGHSLTTKFGQHEIQVEWNPVKILPVETPSQMLWANFTVPDFFEGNWKYLWFSFLLIPLIWGGVVAWRKNKFKNQEKKRKQQLLEEIRNCQSYEDIVAFWKKKRTYLKEFPHLEAFLPGFEEVLFKYQFKPKQTESEKTEVVSAYRKLLNESEGGFRGI